MDFLAKLLVVTRLVGVFYLVLIMVWVGKYRGGLSGRSDTEREFNWHPLLLSTGVIVLNGNAILIYRALRSTKKLTLKLIHGGMNLISVIFLIGGLVAVFESHNYSVPPIPNMYSLHSWIGILVSTMFTCQWVAGFLIFLYPGLKPKYKKIYSPIHIYVGAASFVFAVITSLIGLAEKAIYAIEDYKHCSPEGIFVNCIAIILILYAASVLYVLFNPKYQRKADDENPLMNHSTTETSIKNKSS